MAIRFTCQCGKSLKARENSAGRRTQCPQCGEPVGIPALTPTHRGVVELPGGSQRTRLAYNAPPPIGRRSLAPVAKAGDRPALFLRKQSQAVSSKPAKTKRKRRAATQTIQVRKRSRSSWSKLCGRRGRLVDAIEFGSFNPFASVVCLAVALTISAGTLTRLLPEAQQLGWTALPHGPFFFGALFVMLAAIGYGCSWAGRILSHAARGKPQDFAFDLKLESALAGLSRWVGCFAAGPVLPAFAGFVYWLNCGVMAAIDWLILAELAFVATAWWLTLLVTRDAGGGIRSLLPDRAFVTFCRLGATGIVLTLLVAALLFAAGMVLAQAATLIHAASWGGVLLLAACSVCGLPLLALILQRLGAAYHRTVVSISAPPPIAPGQPAAALR